MKVDLSEEELFEYIKLNSFPKNFKKIENFMKDRNPEYYTRFRQMRLISFASNFALITLALSYMFLTGA